MALLSNIPTICVRKETRYSIALRRFVFHNASTKEK